MKEVICKQLVLPNTQLKIYSEYKPNMKQSLVYFLAFFSFLFFVCMGGAGGRVGTHPGSEINNPVELDNKTGLANLKTKLGIFTAWAASQPGPLEAAGLSYPCITLQVPTLRVWTRSIWTCKTIIPKCQSIHAPIFMCVCAHKTIQPPKYIKKNIYKNMMHM